MFEASRARRVTLVATDDRRKGVRRGRIAARRLTLILGIGAGLVLGACAIPFGNGSEPTTTRSSEETSRDRNRLYLQEQERTERQRQFERVGPSDR